jgi:hypothetical protein
LVVEIEKEEPFDELPDEVKPSLSRLLKIIESSKDESDKHVLLPITSALNKYTELKLEQEKNKKADKQSLHNNDYKLCGWGNKLLLHAKVPIRC